MNTYTGKDYLYIDIANNYGLDKIQFEPRIQWVKDNLDTLEAQMDTADNPLLYIKAVMALRKAEKGIPTGHMMGLDATASVVQIMAALSGCEVSARSSGIIGSLRADVYTKTTEVMNNLLEDQDIIVTTPRKAVKEAQMPFFYMSTAMPKKVFGDETPELAAFYQANFKVAPGACALKDVLAGSWNRDALYHEWDLPDKFHARVAVKYGFKIKVEVDELEHSTFTHAFQDHMTTNEYSEMLGEYVRDDVSINANIIQSVDGYIVREMGRRCNYTKTQLVNASHALYEALRFTRYTPPKKFNTDTIISMVLIEDMDKTIATLSNDDLYRLSTLIESVLEYITSPLLCIHDCFNAGPNHMNKVRYHYREIMAEIADSKLLETILSELHGKECSYTKDNHKMGSLIRQSEYALS